MKRITIPEIKFKSAADVVEVIEEVLEKTPANLKPLVAAVLSLWKWEQNKWVADEGIYSFGDGGKTCALCYVFWKKEEHNCHGCPAECADGWALAVRTGDKRPLIAALEQAVLYEITHEFARRCGGTVIKGLKE